MALLPYCSFILKPCSVLSSCLQTAGPKGPSDPIVTKGISSFRILTCCDDFVPFISPEELLPLEILQALASVTYLHFLSEAACGSLCLLPPPWVETLPFPLRCSSSGCYLSGLKPLSALPGWVIMSVQSVSSFSLVKWGSYTIYFTGCLRGINMLLYAKMLKIISGRGKCYLSVAVIVIVLILVTIIILNGYLAMRVLAANIFYTGWANHPKTQLT